VIVDAIRRASARGTVIEIAAMSETGIMEDIETKTAIIETVTAGMMLEAARRRRIKTGIPSEAIEIEIEIEI
jgi:hypothetical protein